MKDIITLYGKRQKLRHLMHNCNDNRHDADLEAANVEIENLIQNFFNNSTEPKSIEDALQKENPSIEELLFVSEIFDYTKYVSDLLGDIDGEIYFDLGQYLEDNEDIGKFHSAKIKPLKWRTDMQAVACYFFKEISAVAFLHKNTDLAFTNLTKSMTVSGKIDFFELRSYSFEEGSYAAEVIGELVSSNKMI